MHAIKSDDHSGIWIICKKLILDYICKFFIIISSFIGGIQYNSHSGLMWNIALDGNGNPKLPGTDSCGGAGCRGIAQVNSDGSYSVNQECMYIIEIQVINNLDIGSSLLYGSSFQSNSATRRWRPLG